MGLARLSQPRQLGAVSASRMLASRYGRRGGLGFTALAVAPVAAASGPLAPLVIAGATAATFLSKITSLFGKDPAKVQYDAGQDEVYGRLQAEYDAAQAAAARGTLTSNGLLRHIQIMEQALTDLTGLYNALRGKIEASWIDPRYRNVYDFWRKIVNDWRTKWLPTLPGEGVLSSLGMGGNSSIPLLLGGLALVLLARGRRSS